MHDVDAIMEELQRRLFELSPSQNVLDLAFDKQREFIEHPSKKKALFCTRRSSKSFTGGLALVNSAQQFAGSNNLFIGLTRASAEAIIWKDVLKIIDERCELGASFNETKLRMTLPSGSEVLAIGLDKDENEMKKVLGRKFKLIVIDEASMYSISLESLINLLEPALVDQEGTIMLLGTASDFPHGIFFEVTTGLRKDWDLFSWSAHDNPHVARQWQAKLDEIKEKRPDYLVTPQFRQWYLNEWVVDEEKRVYKFHMEKNLIKTLPNLPKDGWSIVLGLDTGWEDDTGFCLTAYHINDPHLYVIKSFKRKKMTFDEVIARINEFGKDEHWAWNRVITDGANKQGIESMRIRSAIPFEYADKQDKVTFIELCNNDLIEARIKILDIPENRPLWEEMASLVWVTEGDKIKYPKKENPTLPNHLCDAFLYAWRCGYHYASQPASKKIIKYSREWYQQQADDIWEREREHIERSHRIDTSWGQMGSLGDLG